MKLQVGERYRMRNGEIVGPISVWGKDPCYRFTEEGMNGRLWNESGKRYMKTNEDPTDIIEHIPKRNTMSEKNSVGVPGVTITIEGIRLTFDQIEKAYAEAKRIKAENEIKAGDFVKWDAIIARVESVVSANRLDLSGNRVTHRDGSAKITNPAHIQALREIYEGMK